MVQTMAQAGHDPAIVAKRAAMTRLLKRFYGHGDDVEECKSVDVPWNVLSIGDSSVEQEALKLCLETFTNSGYSSKPICKTLKLRASPTLTELSNDLIAVQPFLQRLVA